jgi:hypothetical protein
MTENHGTKLGGKLSKLHLGNTGETRLEKTMDALREDHSDLSIRSSSVRKKEGEALMQRAWP